MKAINAIRNASHAIRTLATAMALLATLGYSSLVAALGLGDIEVMSSLNERFNAEIPLFNEGRLDKTQILVKLGSEKDFTRAGIDRPYFLTSLKFDVVSRNGGKVLKITTPDVMREPFLNFVLEVRWPSGKMLKEYTVLLDLPISQQVELESVAPVASSEPAAQPPATAPAPTPEVAVAPAPQEELNRVKKSEAPVTAGSAADYLPKPSPGQSRPVAKTSSRPAPAPVTPAAETPVPSPVVESSVQPVSPAVNVDAEVARLQSELAQSLESLDRAELENRELEERIDTVENQVDDFEKLVELKTEELEAIQSSIEEKQAVLAGDAASEPSVEDSVAAVDAAQVEEASTADQAAADEIAAAEPALVDSLARTVEPDVSPDKATDEPAASAPAASPSLIDRAMGLAEDTAQRFSVSVGVLLGGLAALLALLLGLLLLGKSRGGENYQATVFDDVEPVFTPPEPEQVDTSPAADATGMADSPEVEQAAQPEVTPEPVATPAIEPSNDAAIPAAEEEAQEDPLAEADIYMAYGRYDQAINTLQNAIDAEPERTDVRVKLLEVYQEQGTVGENADAVEAQRAEILSRDADLAPELDALLQPTEPEASLGGADLDDVSAEPQDLGLDLDLDIGSGDSAATEDISPELPTDEPPLAEEVDTKLDLARAYFDMGDFDGARDILQEVIEEGGDAQQEQAREMLAKLA